MTARAASGGQVIAGQVIEGQVIEGQVIEGQVHAELEAVRRRAHARTIAGPMEIGRRQAGHGVEAPMTADRENAVLKHANLVRAGRALDQEVLGLGPADLAGRGQVRAGPAAVDLAAGALAAAVPGLPKWAQAVREGTKSICGAWSTSSTRFCVSCRSCGASDPRWQWRVSAAQEAGGRQ